MIAGFIFIAAGIAAALVGCGIVGLGLVLFGFAALDDAKARKDHLRYLDRRKA